jgi:Na+(H+)/acetate symporter ActP
VVSQTVAVWILIALAVAAANLPFVTERFFGLVPLKAWSRKPAGMIIVELALLYVLIGLMGYGFETAIMNPFARTWEFYVTTLCIFLVLGYPGFVYRYLLKK